MICAAPCSVHADGTDGLACDNSMVGLHSHFFISFHVAVPSDALKFSSYICNRAFAFNWLFIPCRRWRRYIGGSSFAARASVDVYGFVADRGIAIRTPRRHT